jgi:hypothetical protein
LFPSASKRFAALMSFSCVLLLPPHSSTIIVLPRL